ncbi:MAG: transposase domain-containing protein [Thermodesulfobacteriota bacterium]|nr:transposase domain-containing protein [Thermodesulfobacteriota bacterium]
MLSRSGRGLLSWKWGDKLFGKKKQKASDRRRLCISYTALHWKVLYSLIETAKSNGPQPYWYLRYLYTKLPYWENKKGLREIMPYSSSMNKIKEFFSENKIEQLSNWIHTLIMLAAEFTANWAYMAT